MVIGGSVLKVNTEAKFKWFIVISVILASITGIYGQSITYYIVDNLFGREVLSLVGCLTILTIISVLLFLIPAILIWVGIKKLKLSKQIFSKYLLTDVIIGCFTSFWSILILIAWWG